jgi:hypothetical protein
MKQHINPTGLFAILLAFAFLTINADAQETARINLQSVDKLAAKAVEVVRKEEKVKGGPDMVYVRCFEFKQSGEYSETDLQEIRAQLNTPNWSRLMKVEDKDDDRDENETTEIFVFGRREGSEIFGGMTIVSTQPRELAIVNIVGQGKISEIMKHAKQSKPRK